VPINRSSDHNLLFGILALQMDFINRDQLIAAMHAWVLDKDKPLGQILVGQSALPEEQRVLLDALVQQHLKKHGNDPEKSLAALSSVGSLRQELEQIADPDLQVSAAHVSRDHKDGDAYATTATVGTPTSSGLRFRILRPHARGGLGQVSVALDEELRRQVALKEIQSQHADNPDSRARFVLEAEITGGLEHPGIVPVYGLGQYGDGRPFYAMRFIRGDSLKDAVARYHKTDGAQRNSTATAERNLEFRKLLGRFVDVCNAVAYAHSRGVLHRDLKPGNIMLGKYGETLVVDWGLAKLTGRPDGTTPSEEGTLTAATDSGTTPTLMGQALGTPAYMSPEQAAGRLDALGPASDVYSLGATLYCLLTGRAPFENAEPVDVLQRVQKGEFAAPRRVRPSVPMALEAVCLKAMSREPGQRYASPRELADDLEHWLADEPVSARPEPWITRVRRWARRHRPLVASAGALLVTAVVALGIGVVALEQERVRTDRALKAESHARQELAIGVVALEQERVRTDRALKAESRAREAEKQARDRAMAALRAMTDEVENLMARGTTLTEENKEFLRKIIRHFESFAGLNSDDADSRSIRAEGSYRVGLMRYRLGELKEAETAFADALAIRKQLAADFPARPEFRRDLAASHNNLGKLLSDKGYLKEAQEAYAEALAIQKQLAADFPTWPELRQELAGSHHNLGLLLGATGHLKEALAIRKQLAADFPARPEFRRDLAASHDALGSLLGATGYFKEAQDAHADALAIRKQLAADFPARAAFRQELSRSHNNLGLLLGATGHLKEAQEAYAAALAIQKQLAADFPTRPDYRQDLAKSHYNLGNLLRDAGRLKEAETAYTDALHIYKQLAADFPTRADFRQELATTQNNLGALLRSTRRLKEAETAYTDALAIWKQLAADFPTRPELRNDLAGILGNLGMLCNERREFQQARAYLAEALPHHEAALKAGPRNPEYRTFFRNNLSALVAANAGLQDQSAAIQVARKLRDLGWKAPDDAYDAACSLSLCIPIVQGGGKGAMAKRLVPAVQLYGDEAMKMLRDAVAKGYKDADHMKKDADLDPLRSRDDFKKLLAELEAKNKTGK
jgi:serine/threonine-protein kinase